MSGLPIEERRRSHLRVVEATRAAPLLLIILPRSQARSLLLPSITMQLGLTAEPLVRPVLRYSCTLTKAGACCRVSGKSCGNTMRLIPASLLLNLNHGHRTAVQPLFAPPCFDDICPVSRMLDWEFTSRRSAGSTNYAQTTLSLRHRRNPRARTIGLSPSVEESDLQLTLTLEALYLRHPSVIVYVMLRIVVFLVPVHAWQNPCAIDPAGVKRAHAQRCGGPRQMPREMLSSADSLVLLCAEPRLPADLRFAHPVFPRSLVHAIGIITHR